MHLDPHRSAPNRANAEAPNIDPETALAQVGVQMMAQTEGLAERAT